MEVYSDVNGYRIK